MLIDTHAHLTDERYGGAREIIDDMTADGLERIITVGYDMESSRECKRIAESNAAIYFDACIRPTRSGFPPIPRTNSSRCAPTQSALPWAK